MEEEQRHGCNSMSGRFFLHVLVIDEHLKHVKRGGGLLTIRNCIVFRNLQCAPQHPNTPPYMIHTTQQHVKRRPGLAIRGLLNTHRVTDTTTYRLHRHNLVPFSQRILKVKLCSSFRRGILKRARSLPPEEFLLPQKLVEQLRRGEGKHGKTHDSGFNSEQNSSYVVSEGNSGTACDVASNVFNSELGSNYLAHYGLDGPLAEYQPPPSEYGNDAPEEPSEVDIFTQFYLRGGYL